MKREEQGLTNVLRTHGTNAGQAQGTECSFPNSAFPLHKTILHQPLLCVCVLVTLVASKGVPLAYPLQICASRGLSPVFCGLQRQWGARGGGLDSVGLFSTGWMSADIALAPGILQRMAGE